MFHFSLRTLIGVVALVAVGCAALMNAAPWIASTATTLMFLALALATVAATLGEVRRGFWAGFAIVGWTYMFVLIGPMDDGFKQTLWTTVILHRGAAAAPQAFVNVQQPMYTPTTAYRVSVTTTANGAYTSQLVPQTTPLTPAPGVPASAYIPTPQPLPPTIRMQNEPFLQSFLHIGQALWTLLFAFMGGLFGACVMARNRRQTPVRTA